EWEESDVRVVLFVVLEDGIELTPELEKKIKTDIRKNTTPRHVPAKILAVADVPYTISGKKVELAVKRMVHNLPITNRDALANPEALENFKDLEALKS
ncbi:acetoacetate--CoA ligase, partial [bacterium]|nr:acetoacetate--CoA ligase [bacterium]